MKYISEKLVLIILSQILNGCVANKQEIKVDIKKKDGLYQHNKDEIASCEKDIESISSSKTIDTNETKILMDDIPSKHFSGIVSASILNKNLYIKIIDEDLYEEIKAPLSYTVVTVTNKKCTDIWIKPKYANKELKTKTGNIQWKESEYSHKILVTYKNNTQDFYIRTKNKTNIIDLDKKIPNEEFTNLNIKIECEDCDLLNNEYKNIFNEASNAVILNYNPEKNENKLTFNKIQKNISVKNKNNIFEEKKGVIENIQQIKEKCIELGFKPNSDKFGKCVLELTE
jgi:hypothetical protein